MNLVISDFRPYDGEYDFDVGEFNRREWGWIKKFAGYLPGDVEKGFVGFDQDLYAVFAIVALHRAGRIDQAEAAHIFERFQEGGAIRLVGDVEAENSEDDAGPPAVSSNGNGISSGPGSSESSETSEPTRYVPGTADSAISVSVPSTSAT